MPQRTVYEAAGGAAAFLALAAATHERCLRDPLLEHPFSHGGQPDHVQRLASYLAEVFGGPADYTNTFGGHSAMMSVHAGEGIDQEYGDAFAACYVQAMDDAGLPDDPRLREVLRSYMDWAVSEMLAFSPAGSQVPPGLVVPHWSWDGLRPG